MDQSPCTVTMRYAPKDRAKGEKLITAAKAKDIKVNIHGGSGLTLVFDLIGSADAMMVMKLAAKYWPQI